MEGKIRKFEEFLNERLRGDLEKVMISRDRVAEQLAQYLQLKNVVELIQSKGMSSQPLRTQVDLGCNFYAQAKVVDPSTICVNVGLGYYIQYTLPEALAHIERRMKSLNQTADQLAVDASKIKAHIKTVLEGLREMQNISAEDPKPHRDVW